MIIPTTSDLIYQEIQSMLMSGELKPDDKINVDELSRIFNISKTPIREVLKKFEQEGLIIYQPRIGWRVKKFSREQYFNAVEIQELIEEYICSNIEGYISNINFDELYKANNEIAEAINNKEYEKILDLNEKFHLIIYDAYPNTQLLDNLKSIWDSIKIQRNAMVKTPAFFQNITLEHNGIINALKNKKFDALLEACKQHFNSGKEVINEYFEEIEKL